MRLFQAALDTPLDSPLLRHPLSSTVCTSRFARPRFIASRKIQSDSEKNPQISFVIGSVRMVCCERADRALVIVFREGNFWGSDMPLNIVFLKPQNWSWLKPCYSETEIQPKEEVFGRISLRTSGQKLRSGPPNARKKTSILGRTTPRRRPWKNFGLKNFGLIFRSPSY